MAPEMKVLTVAPEVLIDVGYWQGSEHRQTALDAQLPSGAELDSIESLGIPGITWWFNGKMNYHLGIKRIKNHLPTTMYDCATFIRVADRM